MTEEEKNRLLLVESALFGNVKIGEIGMVKKVDEIWTVLVGLSFIGKLGTWLAVIIAGVGSVWGIVWSFIKHSQK